jgi:hypothetical protein
MCAAMKNTFNACPDEPVGELPDEFIMKYGVQPDGFVCLPPVAFSGDHYLPFEKYEKQTINLVIKVRHQF